MVDQKDTITVTAHSKTVGKYAIGLVVAFIGIFVLLIVMQPSMVKDKDDELNWGTAAGISALLPGGILVIYLLYLAYNKYIAK